MHQRRIGRREGHPVAVTGQITVAVQRGRRVPKCVGADDTGCRHLGARAYGSDMVGRAHCPDCGRYVWIFEIINGYLDEMQEQMLKLREEKDHDR